MLRLWAPLHALLLLCPAAAQAQHEDRPAERRLELPPPLDSGEEQLQLDELVRDNGVVASAELRVPLVKGPLGRDILQLAPFVDFGKAWNRDRDRSLHSIASLGLGLRWRIAERSWLHAYWAPATAATAAARRMGSIATR